jgi:hypothetical protein
MTKIDKYELKVSTREHILDTLDTFEDGIIYLVTAGIGDMELPWLVGFRCPCGCGVERRIPVYPIGGKKDADGYGWGYSEENGKVTLTPSIFHQEGCKSHYFIKGGIVQWA